MGQDGSRNNVRKGKGNVRGVCSTCAEGRDEGKINRQASPCGHVAGL